MPGFGAVAICGGGGGRSRQPLYGTRGSGPRVGAKGSSGINPILLAKRKAAPYLPWEGESAEAMKRPELYRTPIFSRVTGCLPGCCTPVTHWRSATCSLTVMQETTNHESKGLKGGQYARTEDELYKKAIALLDKCKIESQHSGQEAADRNSAA